MKRAPLWNALLLSACAVPHTMPPPSLRDMAVRHDDLALETPAGRAELVKRVERAVKDFCAAYDPHDQAVIFDARLASARHCPGYATILLMNKAPPAVRRAYRASVPDRRAGIVAGR